MSALQNAPIKHSQVTPTPLRLPFRLPPCTHAVSCPHRQARGGAGVPPAGLRPDGAGCWRHDHLAHRPLQQPGALDVHGATQAGKLVHSGPWDMAWVPSQRLDSSAVAVTPSMPPPATRLATCSCIIYTSSPLPRALCCLALPLRCAVLQIALSNAEAIDFVENVIKTEGIECGFTRCPAYVLPSSADAVPGDSDDPRSSSRSDRAARQAGEA